MSYFISLGMVALLGDCPNEILSSLSDHTPARCTWANCKWRLRAIKLRFRATVNISLGQSPKCATITQEIVQVLQKNVFFLNNLLLECFDITV